MKGVKVSFAELPIVTFICPICDSKEKIPWKLTEKNKKESSGLKKWFCPNPECRAEFPFPEFYQENNRIIALYESDRPCKGCETTKRKETIDLTTGKIIQNICANCGMESASENLN